MKGFDMNPKFYEVLVMAIEQGVSLGVDRCFKHEDEIRMEDMKNTIEMHVIDSLHEWFHFWDEESE